MTEWRSGGVRSKGHRRDACATIQGITPTLRDFATASLLHCFTSRVLHSPKSIVPLSENETLGRLSPASNIASANAPGVT